MDHFVLVTTAMPAAEAVAIRVVMTAVGAQVCEGWNISCDKVPCGEEYRLRIIIIAIRTLH